MPDVLTTEHRRWREFQDRLAIVVIAKQEPPLEYRCDNDHAHTRRILRAMGFSAADIEATLAYWAEYTANACDCQTLDDALLDSMMDIPAPEMGRKLAGAELEFWIGDAKVRTVTLPSDPLAAQRMVNQILNKLGHEMNQLMFNEMGDDEFNGADVLVCLARGHGPPAAWSSVVVGGPRWPLPLH
jgi:hypothetical protein